MFVSSSYSSFYNNGQYGLSVFQLVNNGGAAVHIEDVKAMNNGFAGIGASGTGVTIRNADAPNNPDAGLEIFRTNGYDDQLTDITLDGQVTLNNNVYNGLSAGFGVVGTLKVSGNLVTNLNTYDGLFFLSGDTTAVSVVLGDGSSSGKSGKTSSSGSITSCNNGQTVIGFDIRNFGSSTFEGTDYTCTNTEGTGDLPVCTPCYPDYCVSTSEDNGARNLMPGDEYEMMDTDTSVHDI